MFLAVFFIAFANCRKKSRLSAKYNPEKEGRWFYQQLTKYQKPFYEALEYWRVNNLLTKAPMMYLESDTNIKHNVQENLIKQYAIGASNALNIHFTSAIAAWRFDHPEMFYIDVSKLLFRISQDENHHSKILFGCITYPNLLYDFVKADKINSMITQFNAKVKEIVDLAKDKKNITEKVTAVHDYLKAHVKYTRPYATETEEEANWVNEAYGSLIYGKSVCDGFSKSFQIVMNELNVSSVRIPGDALDSNGNAQSHAWNVVQLEDNIWYLVDTTYDTTANTNKWLLISQVNTSDTHFPNGKLDSCGVTFIFPPSPYPNQDKWDIRIEINEDTGEAVNIFVSYDGMNATGLNKVNYSLCYKYVFYSNSGTITESPWIDYAVQYSQFDHLDEHGIYVRFLPSNAKMYQFGIAPKDCPHFKFSDLDKMNYGVNDTYVSFKSNQVFLNISYENRSMNDNLLNPAVRYYSPTPRHFFPGYEYDFVFSMTEHLIAQDDSDVNLTKFNITLTAVSLNGYDKMAGKDKELGKKAVLNSVVRNVRLLNSQTIGVTIKTSDNYAHDHMDYTVHFNGLKGSVSQLPVVPFTFMVHFFPNNGGTNTCSKMFGKGTLYVAGRPVLITDGDIRNGGTNNDFVAEGPNGVISGKGATTSDIALVATRADNVSEGYKEYTATFDISLTLFCMANLIKPDTFNCPLTIQLPFPEGFDPIENEGVTFEVIHYKGDGTNEKNTVVVSPSGLLITVNSFSPFKIQPIKTSVLALDDSFRYPLYTSSFGGSPNVTINNKDIKNQVIGYTLGEKISIKPPYGTRIEKIFLNSKSLNVLNDLEGITLQKDDLNVKSNNLEVHIITYNVLAKEYDNKISPIYYTADVSSKSQSEAAKSFDNKLPSSITPDTAAMVDPDLEGTESFYPGGIDENEVEPDIPDIDEKDEESLNGEYQKPNKPAAPRPDEIIDDNEDIDSISESEPGQSDEKEPEPVQSEIDDNDDNGGNSDGDGKGKGLGAGPIAGIVIGVIAAVAIVVILVYFFVIRPKKLHDSSDKAVDEIEETASKKREDGTGL